MCCCTEFQCGGDWAQLDYFRNVQTPQVDTVWRSKLPAEEHLATLTNFEMVEETAP